jgi:phospholipid-binding lipoprotein MlaA
MGRLLTDKQAMTVVVLLCLFFVALTCPALAKEERAAAGPVIQGNADDDTPAAENGDANDEDWLAEEQMTPVADPLEPLNRFFFQFNDRLYFWVLKPTATLYSHLVAKTFRIGIRNAFANLLAPARVVNNVLQGKMGNAGVELQRFLLNSTIGVVGLADVAKNEFKLPAKDEDLGQTFGFYGAGPGLYINWPVLGPSNFRDSIGKVGDAFLDPLNYLADNIYVRAAIYGGEQVNYTSLTLGDYELFTKTAIDPYAAVRDAYQQFRQGRIEDKNEQKEGPLHQ